MVLRVGDAAWLVGVGKRALPLGFRCLYSSLLVARWLGSKLIHYFSKYNAKRQTEQGKAR